ncbi:hypothetical protein Tco_1282881 [Tanacetum coccineum]
MSTSKTYQQSLADAGSETRTPMLERGSYIPWASSEQIPRLQTAEDLEGDDLLLHDAEMEVMNMILLSIPNEIYNSVDACTSAKDMWKRVEHPLVTAMLLLGQKHYSNFSNLKIIVFVLHPHQKSSNHLRSKVNIQAGTLVILEELADEMCSRGGCRGNECSKEMEMFKGTLRTHIQAIFICSMLHCSGKGHYARNYPKQRVRDSKYFMEQMLLAKQDEAGIILSDEQNDFLFADASRMEEIEELSANICLMARIQPADHTSDDGPSDESAFISELDELEKQNDLLKDQLLEASLKHDVELCVLINHECVDKILNAELEKVKKKSFEIQEGLQARIKILLNKDVQRLSKQSVDFQLKLQHEKEKQKWDSTLKNKNTNPLDYSWISRMEKLENENASLDFKVQSLIKEHDNAKMEYKKLFDSIKKTRSQTQKEMD